MANQIFRGFAMLILLTGLALLMPVASANGQSGMQVANIPFEFNVGDTTLPSGKYAVKAILAGGEALVIRGEDSHSRAIRLTNSVRTARISERGKLVFRRYGQQYFLVQVWAAGEETGRELLKSKRERALQRELAGIASLNERGRSTGEIVEILAIAR